MTLRRLAQLLIIVALTAMLSGCLFRTRIAKRTASTAPLKTATAQELIQDINNDAAKIQTLNLTVDIATSVGGAKKGKVTDYKEIRGYVLLRKPEMLRLIGLLPIVRNKAFDMVSNGNGFKLYIPPTNKFYVGPSEVTVPSKNTLENLRPQMFYDALLLRPIDPHDEIAVLESGTEIVVDPKTKKEQEQPDYSVDVIRRGPHGWYLSRKVVFSRTDLQPRQQLIYDQTGQLVTDAHYDELRDYNGVTLPSVIEIWRPREEYSITLTIVKANKINEPIKDEQFVLDMPRGATIINLDQPRQQTTPAGSHGH